MKRALLAVLLLVGGLLVTVPATATPPARAVTAAVATTPVVAIAGDSTAAGWNLNPWERFAPSLAARLRTEGGLPDATVSSFACGGQRLYAGTQATSATGCTAAGGTVSLPSQWPFILNTTPKPTTILVLIGFNDAFTPDDTQFTNTYRKLVDDAAAVGIRVLPCLMVAVAARFSSYSVVSNPLHWWRLWLVNTYGVDAQRTDLATQITPSDEHMDPVFDSGDGVHPGKLGPWAMARSVDLSRIV